MVGYSSTYNLRTQIHKDRSKKEMNVRYGKNVLFVDIDFQPYKNTHILKSLLRYGFPPQVIP